MVGIYVIIAILIISVFVVYIPYYRGKKKNNKTTATNSNANASVGSKELQLQAYERLILLTDRIALPNLVNRLNEPNLTAKEMQLLLNQNIRQEFDYNITQQIYVSAEAWNALKNLKEQNLLIINQMANVLPADASGYQLLKLIMEFLMNDKRATLHEVVSNVLSFEAKKIM